jgi:hypothetical protein
MEALLNRLTSHDIVGIVMFSLVFLAGVIVWLSLQWRLHRRTEMEAGLKQLMLERGMSAQDIERVIRARGKGVQAEEPASEFEYHG